MPPRELQAADFLRFRPEHLCDPPPWFISQLDKKTMKLLAINEIEMHKSILEAQIRASEKSLEILARMR